MCAIDIFNKRSENKNTKMSQHKSRKMNGEKKKKKLRLDGYFMTEMKMRFLFLLRIEWPRKKEKKKNQLYTWDNVTHSKELRERERVSLFCYLPKVASQRKRTEKSCTSQIGSLRCKKKGKRDLTFDGGPKEQQQQDNTHSNFAQ